MDGLVSAIGHGGVRLSKYVNNMGGDGLVSTSGGVSQNSDTVIQCNELFHSCLDLLLSFSIHINNTDTDTDSLCIPNKAKHIIQ